MKLTLLVYLLLICGSSFAETFCSDSSLFAKVDKKNITISFGRCSVSPISYQERPFKNHLRILGNKIFFRYGNKDKVKHRFLGEINKENQIKLSSKMRFFKSSIETKYLESNRRYWNGRRYPQMKMELTKFVFYDREQKKYFELRSHKKVIKEPWEIKQILQEKTFLSIKKAHAPYN